MTILTVKHVTTYSYAAPVRLGEHRMMLRPRDSNDQRLLKGMSRSLLKLSKRSLRIEIYAA
jgi:transglutaminase-like putative cysteine protease